MHSLKWLCLVAIVQVSWGWSKGLNETIFDFRISKLYGVYTFLEAAAQTPFSDKGLREALKKSHAFSAVENTQLEVFKQLVDELSHTETSPGCTKEKALRRLAILNPELEDFKKASRALLTETQEKTLETLLRAFDPVYTRAVWNPTSTHLGNFRYKLNGLLKEHPSHQDWVKRIRDFLGAKKDLTPPILVGIFSVPSQGGSSSAAMFCDTISLSVLSGSKNYANRLALLFHELTHLINQETATRKSEDLHAVIMNSPYPESPLVHPFLDEILATSIGQGWIYKQLTLELDPTAWYSHPVIDILAKEIFPRTETYLNAGKNLDTEYFKTLIEKTHTSFPRAHLKPEFAFQNVSYIVDGKSLKNGDVKSFLYERLKPQTVFGYSPMNHPHLFKDLAHQFSNIIVFKTPQTGKEYFDLMAKLFPHADFRKRLQHKKGSFIFMAEDALKRMIVTVSVEGVREIPAALKQLAGLGELSPRPLFIALKK